MWIEQGVPVSLKMLNGTELFQELSALATEGINPRTTAIDQATTAEVVNLLLQEDRRVVEAVQAVAPQIAKAIDAVVPILRDGGSLIYVGAGTSGRLGILDASEMPPTYGVPPTMVRGIIAGGTQAVFRSVEGAEDNTEAGAQALRTELEGVHRAVVCGISASGRTPFVLGALHEAHRRGLPTIFISTNEHHVVHAFAPYVDTLICAHIGPEPIAGSTRMNSGTAQKLILNAITTASMVRLGKTYGNVMVDLQLTNEKLVQRAHRIVMTIAGVDYQAASEALQGADGSVKVAIVMAACGCSRSEAVSTLEYHHGSVRAVLESQQ